MLENSQYFVKYHQIKFQMEEIMRLIKNYIIGPLSGLVFIIGFSLNSIAADSELIVFDWGGYEDPGFFQAYIEKYGDSPTYSFFSDEEEAFQKVRAGFRADLGHPCSQSVVKWRNAGIIKPIDTSRLKNWSKVDPVSYTHLTLPTICSV